MISVKFQNLLNTTFLTAINMRKREKSWKNQWKMFYQTSSGTTAVLPALHSPAGPITFKMIPVLYSEEEEEEEGIIDLRVLSGNIEEISREGSFELVGALLKYIQCTKRF